MPLFGANSEFEGSTQRVLQSVELLTLCEWMVQFSTVPCNLIHIMTNRGFDSESVRRQNRQPNRREFDRLWGLEAVHRPQFGVSIVLARFGCRDRPQEKFARADTYYDDAVTSADIRLASSGRISWKNCSHSIQVRTTAR